MDNFNSIIINAYKFTGKTLLPDEQHLIEFFGEIPVSEDEMNEE
jgi:hypothetical protein